MHPVSGGRDSFASEDELRSRLHRDEDELRPRLHWDEIRSRRVVVKARVCAFSDGRARALTEEEVGVARVALSVG